MRQSSWNTLQKEPSKIEGPRSPHHHRHHRAVPHRPKVPAREGDHAPRYQTANIILKSTYPIAVKLADFGLASASPTETGIAGTLTFCAPEIFKFRHHSTPVDIWALAVTILHLFEKIDPAKAQRLVRNYQNSDEQIRWFKYLERLWATFPREMEKFLFGMMDHPKYRWTAAQCLSKMEPLHKCVQKDHIRGSRARPKAGATPSLGTLIGAFERFKNHRRTW